MKANLTTGEKLQDLRKERGLTIKQVCDMIQTEYNFTLSTGKLNEMENDKPKDHGFKSFVYLAKFYNVSVDYLLGLSDISSIPTDGKLQAAAEVTGLSLGSIQLLENTAKYNSETWHTDIINGFLESDHFKKIIYYLTESITKNSHEIEYDVFKTSTDEIAETIATKEFHLLIDELRVKFKARIEHDDRVWYMALNSLYAEGKISDLQFRQTQAEFAKGNYSYSPLDGGAENGKHNPSKE